VDLPGAEAVAMGVALAGHGFRPVPLFNGTSGPHEVIEVYPIVRALAAWARTMQTQRLLPDAPPAFLLDSRRTELPALPSPATTTTAGSCCRRTFRPARCSPAAASASRQ
jgi:hypothetical protein